MGVPFFPSREEIRDPALRQRMGLPPLDPEGSAGKLPLPAPAGPPLAERTARVAALLQQRLAEARAYTERNLTEAGSAVVEAVTHPWETAKGFVTGMAADAATTFLSPVEGQQYDQSFLRAKGIDPTPMTAPAVSPREFEKAALNTGANVALPLAGELSLAGRTLVNAGLGAASADPGHELAGAVTNATLGEAVHQTFRATGAISRRMKARATEAANLQAAEQAAREAQAFDPRTVQPTFLRRPSAAGLERAPDGGYRAPRAAGPMPLPPDRLAAAQAGNGIPSLDDLYAAARAERGLPPAEPPRAVMVPEAPPVPESSAPAIEAAQAYPAPLDAPKPPAPRFYSRLQRAVEGAKMQKGTADQWIAALSQNVAADERAFTGVDALLAERKAAGKPVTKAELLDHLKDHGIQLGERVLSEMGDLTPEQQAAFVEAQAQRDRVSRTFTDAHVGWIGALNRVVDELWRQARGHENPSVRNAFNLHSDPLYRLSFNAGSDAIYPKHDGWYSTDANWSPDDAWHARLDADEVLARFDRHINDTRLFEGEGGTLRELGFHIPDHLREAVRAAHEPAQRLAYENWQADQALQKFEELRRDTKATYGTYVTPGGTNYREVLPTLDGRPAGAPTARTHWSPRIADILGHLRFTDRVLPDGRRALHVEEAQSDWHQEGRKRGYDGPEAQARIKAVERQLSESANLIEQAHQRREELQARFEEARAARERGYREATERLRDNDRAGYNAAIGEADRVGAIATRLRERRWAYDRAIRRLNDRHTAIGREFDRAQGGSRGLVPDAPMKGTDEWAGMLVRRALDEAVKGGYDVLTWTTGDQAVTNVGSKDPAGMRYFYDKMVRKLVEESTKKATGRKAAVEAIDLGPSATANPDRVKRAAEKIPGYVAPGTGVQGIPITPELTRAVYEKGLPLYSGLDIPAAVKAGKLLIEKAFGKSRPARGIRPRSQMWEHLYSDKGTAIYSVPGEDGGPATQLILQTEQYPTSMRRPDDLHVVSIKHEGTDYGELHGKRGERRDAREVPVSPKATLRLFGVVAEHLKTTHRDAKYLIAEPLNEGIIRMIEKFGGEQVDPDTWAVRADNIRQNLRGDAQHKVDPTDFGIDPADAGDHYASFDDYVEDHGIGRDEDGQLLYSGVDPLRLVRATHAAFKAGARKFGEWRERLANEEGITFKSRREALAAFRKADGRLSALYADGVLNYEKFALDPDGTQHLRAVAESPEMQALRASHQDTLAERRRLAFDIADTIGADYTAVNAERAKALTPAELMARDLVVQRNSEHAAKLMREAEAPETTDARREQIDAELAAVSRQSAEVVKDLIVGGGEAGRRLQALRMDLATNEPAAVLYHAKRALGPDKPLTPELYTELMALRAEVERAKGTPKERQAKYDLARRIQRLRTASVPDQLVTFFKTAITLPGAIDMANLVSNTASMAGRGLSNLQASVWDVALSALTGQRTRTNPVTSHLGGAAAGLRQGVSDIPEIFRSNIDHSRQKYLPDAREITLLPGAKANAVVNAYLKAHWRRFGAADAVFREYAIARAIRDEARVQAMNERLSGAAAAQRVQEIEANPSTVPGLVGRALAEADYVTFTGDNRLAQGIQRFGSALGPAGRAAVNTLVPFTRTVANVADMTVDYTPGVGLGRELFRVAADAVKGRDFNQRRFVDALGQQGTGTAALALGAWLAAQGLATGGIPETQAERDQWDAEGKQPFSVKVGGEWRDITRVAGPFATLVGAGADLVEFQRRLGQTEPGMSPAEKFTKVRRDYVGAVASQAPGGALTVFGDRATRDPEGSIASSLITPVVTPAPLAAVARGLDPKERVTEGLGDQLRARTPWLRQGLPEKLGPTGEPVTHPTEGVVGQWLDPTRPRTATPDPVLAELTRLDLPLGNVPAVTTYTAAQQGLRYERGETPHLVPERYRRTPEARNAITRLAGPELLAQLRAVMSDPGYASIPDDYKRVLIGRLIDQARSAAATRVTGEQLDRGEVPTDHQ